MKSGVVFVFAFFLVVLASAQSSYRAVIRDSVTQEPLEAVTVVVSGAGTGGTSLADGSVQIDQVPDGVQKLVFTLIGYSTRELEYQFPLSDTQGNVVLLRAEGAALDEIIVEGTRSNRGIANIPTRVEVLTEEIDEAATMDPSKIAHLLTHSTGIQVQQTSATSNTANVRIQGLDGRYTQILKDGFPLYGGFSGSLSIMQIPPLDLRQVEYIKGSSSTLYGGGAIAGLINLISKDPNQEETTIHLNASHIGARDVNAFLSRRKKSVGFTMLAQRNTHEAFDADGDGYSDMPALTKYNFNPRLFFYLSPRLKLSLGGTFTTESRRGGDMALIEGRFADSAHFYSETNEISRTTSQLRMDYELDERKTFTLRNSFNVFDRSLTIGSSPAPDQYRFSGKQVSSFSEAAFTARSGSSVLITGLNFYTDDFRERSIHSEPLRNEGYNTAGAFVNYTFDPFRFLAVESGLRADYVFGERWFVLPRLAVLIKWTDKLTTRVGGGLGYRNPTIFNQEAELYGYRNVVAIERDRVKAEQSYGGNADIGYKTSLGDRMFLNLNQMFFATLIEDPIVLAADSYRPGYYHFVNAAGYTRTYGAESFLKFGFYDFVLFVGYTYTKATRHFGSSEQVVALTPAHSLKGDLLYSLPQRWRIGMDYEYKSAQTLSTGLESPSYWTFGALVEYTWRNFTIYGNVENFTNVRQTNYGSLRSAPYDTPQFTEVWGPLDGIVFNYGVKLRM